ncbi:hypothetical protein Tco_0641119 [Tanacetum coccineum]
MEKLILLKISEQQLVPQCLSHGKSSGSASVMSSHLIKFLKRREMRREKISALFNGEGPVRSTKMSSLRPSEYSKDIPLEVRPCHDLHKTIINFFASEIPDRKHMSTKVSSKPRYADALISLIIGT